MKPYSVDTPTPCCCNLFLLTTTCHRIGTISPLFQPTVQFSTTFACGSLCSNTPCTFQQTAINRIFLPVVEVKHTMYDTFKYIFGTKIFSFSPEELPQCDTIYHMYSNFQCEPKPRLPIARPVTIPFTITSIIVYLPRWGEESDNISLSRSVMRMFLIMMLNFLLFPRFCLWSLVFAQETQLARTVSNHTHTRSAHRYR